MIDFLRVISPFLYVLIPTLIILFVVYKAATKYLPDSDKPTIKLIYRLINLVALAWFAIAVLKMTVINEIPQNDVDHSIKKERSDYSVEQAKKDTITIN